MILRSVMRHVREQNWVAVGIDFLIVVVGVFIGIQVANWNDERRAQADLKAALGNLAQEIANTAERREDQVAWQEWAVRGYASLIDLVDGVELDEEARADAYRAIVLPYPPPEPSRYETLYELQNSGQLKEIPSRELRGALGELLSGDRIAGSYFERWLGGLTAPPFSNRIVTYALSEPNEDGDRSMRVTDVDLELARADPDFRARAVQMRWLFQTNAQTQRTSLVLDRLVLELLESEGYRPSGNWLEQNRERLGIEASARRESGGGTE